jgi:peptidoglycan hydrolase-like protein with peptidoglycan-binding domain
MLDEDNFMKHLHDPYRTLRKGDEGPEVVTLQQALTELGYLNGAADGNFGTGTQTAVKKFQEDNSLDADGIAGKMTQEVLFKKSSVTPMPETTVGPNDILDLPGRLNERRGCEA